MSADLGRFRTEIRAHLDWFAERGEKVRFWWRDDDAVAPSATLDRLLSLAGRHDVDVALAVIPKDAAGALAARLAQEPHAVVLQHGWQHANHQRKDKGEKSAELGSRRPLSEALNELGEGKARLEALFGTRFVPALVPPWNRIDPAITRCLTGLGFAGLSTYTWMHFPNAGQVQTHVDMIDWRGGCGFIGWEAARMRLDLQLARRRTNPREPVGLLSHHLVQDEASFAFLDEVLTLTRHHEGADWPPIPGLFDQPFPD